MFQDSDNYNQVLTTYAQGAFQNPGAVLDVAALLFPTVVVEEFDGNFYKYDPSAAFRAIDTRMARNNTPVSIEFKKTKGEWNCEPNGIETPTLKFTTKTVQGANARRIAAQYLASASWTSRQQMAVDYLHEATPVESELGGWLGAQGMETDPITELHDAIWKVGKGCANDANTILFGAEAWAAFCSHPKVLARLKNTDTTVTADDLRKWLNRQDLNIKVAETRVDGGADQGFIHLLTHDVVVFYTQEAVTEDDQSFGKTFTMMPDGPELVSYEDKGVYVKDLYFWAEDKQVTNPNAAVRFVLHAKD